MRNLLSNTLSLNSHGLLWLFDLRLRKYNSHLAMRNAILQSVSRNRQDAVPSAAPRNGNRQGWDCDEKRPNPAPVKPVFHTLTVAGRRGQARRRAVQ